MKAETRVRLTYFNRDYVSERIGRVTIGERNPAGAGSITFDISRECIEVLAKPSTHHFFWLSEQSCADGAFILFEGDDFVHLHIVEIKSKLTHKGWLTVRKQFSGMFLNSMALCGVIGLPEFKTVTCYIAYATENISSLTTASPVLLKGRLGLSATPFLLEDWVSGRVDAAWASAVPLVKLQRDAAGNANLAV